MKKKWLHWHMHLFTLSLLQSFFFYLPSLSSFLPPFPPSSLCWSLVYVLDLLVVLQDLALPLWCLCFDTKESQRKCLILSVTVKGSEEIHAY